MVYDQNQLYLEDIEEVVLVVVVATHDNDSYLLIPILTILSRSSLPPSLAFPPEMLVSHHWSVDSPHLHKQTKNKMKNVQNQYHH